MNKIGNLLLFFLATHVSAQPLMTDSTLLVKPLFNIGDEKTYLVTEKTSDNITIIPLKATHHFMVTSKVLDTANGYTFLYTAKTMDTKNNGDYLESIRATISDDLKIAFVLNREGNLVTLKNYTNEQDRIVGLVDSMIAADGSKKKYYLQLLHILKKKLQEPAGLELCLEPMVLFYDLYTKPVFRLNKDYSYGSSVNILNQDPIAGTIIVQWKKNKSKGDVEKVIVGFVATSDSAAKYMSQTFREVYSELMKGKSPNYVPEDMKSISERQYDIFLSNGYPKQIHYRKKEIYLNKMIREIDMELME